MDAEYDWEGNIRRNYPALIKDIDPKSGLEGALRKRSGEFTPLAVKSIFGYPDRIKVNDQLLRHILNGGPSRFDAFCDALEEVGQNNIVSRKLRPGPDTVNAVLDDTESVGTPDARDEMILNRESQHLLRRNWNELLQSIDSDTEFLSYLKQLNVFTVMQDMKLEDTEDAVARNNLMLQWLERGSQRMCDDFCEAMRRRGLASHVPLLQSSPGSLQPVRPADRAEQEDIVEMNTVEVSQPVEESQQPCYHIGISTAVPASEPQSWENHPASESRIWQCSEDSERYPAAPCEPCEPMLFDLREGLGPEVNHPMEDSSDISPSITRKFAELQKKINEGADKDEEALKTLFEERSFEVAVHRDVTKEQLLGLLEEEKSDPLHRVADVFVMVVMSHGKKNKIFTQDCQLVKLDDMRRYFHADRCELLAGKPKIFFIQACQGDKVTEGVDGGFDIDGDSEIPDRVNALDTVVCPSSGADDWATDRAQCRVGLHPVSDVVTVMATVEDYAAWRHEERGSVFVQKLVKVFQQHSDDMDVHAMLTKVCDEMSHDPTVYNGVPHTQICQVKDSTLRKLVYFLRADLRQSFLQYRMDNRF